MFTEQELKNIENLMLIGAKTAPNANELLNATQFIMSVIHKLKSIKTNNDDEALEKKKSQDH